jgi:hypothetical protein
MSQTNEKAQEVRRMLSGGRELSHQQRQALLHLHARFDKLWERREGEQDPKRQEQSSRKR